ncbi:MAG: tRNA (guanosine(46)-N7)-methyltransferase TrmB, partial [Calditrichaeota bacterium]
MAKQKRLRKEALKSFANVTHSPQELKGKWKSVIFRNDAPISLELGCGHGNYSIALAQKYRDRNFVGIDLKGARLWVGAKYALEQQLSNIFFIRMNILDLADVFDADDIDEIWIPFPDPYPKKPRKRLTAPRFLAVYQQICKPQARLHLKTDVDGLYESAIESISSFGCTLDRQILNLYAEPHLEELLNIQTSYEKK